MTDTPVEQLSFEQAIKELEAVVARLERGEVALDESIALYERGAKLKARCEAKLKEAEEKVAKITFGADGAPSGTAPSTLVKNMLAAKPLPLQQALAQTSLAVDAYVKAALAEFDLPVARAMSYAVEGGKSLRGFLVLETARLHGIGGGAAISAAAAIECLHAYSLIHDDLPCMDDDDLRRGRPTVHRKWDEATAVLAGDALQSLALELVLETECSAEARLDLARNLAKAAGVAGMVGGQAMDIAAETASTPLSLADVEALQSGKTGALITWSALAGPRMARSDLRPLKVYGDALGRAFQIADDILDVEGDAAAVGKAVGKDAEAGKATFISHLGLDGAKRLAQDLVTEACDALADYGSDAETLRDVARFVIARDR